MEQQLIQLEQFDQHKEILNRIYDAVRIVNPKAKKIMDFQGSSLSETDFHCYSFWEGKRVCENCIAMRAFFKKETYFKLEYKNDRVFMVTAVPIQSGSEILTLELIKDVTNSLTIDETGATGSHIIDTLYKLNQLQVRDGLTGLLNRRYIDERLPIDIMNSAAGKQPLSIIMADIDRFKLVNDNYGHIAGDHILKEFAKMLATFTKPESSWAARYGGEEFLIVLMNTDMEAAENLAESIRLKIESSEIAYNDTIIKITSSFGVSTLSTNYEITPEVFIDYADKNLYKAKSGGRNKVAAGAV